MDDQLKKFLAGVVGVIEATSFEKFCIWEKCHKRGDDWKQGDGIGETIGEIDGRPVHLSLLVDTVNSQRILFWHATSTVVDHKMIEDWLKKTLPVTAFEDNDPRNRMNKTDANNWHIVIKKNPVYVDYTRENLEHAGM
jgi:hypothetical protein